MVLIIFDIALDERDVQAAHRVTIFNDVIVQMKGKINELNVIIDLKFEILYEFNISLLKLIISLPEWIYLFQLHIIPASFETVQSRAFRLVKIKYLSLYVGHLLNNY